MDIADFSLGLFSLAGRNALVTGGNTGLGRAFSLALAKAGADVFAVGLAEDDGTTRRLIEGAGRRMEFMVADITHPGVPAAAVHRCVEALGSVDILVNSAGIALLSDVEDFGRDQWDPMVSVNMTAAFEPAEQDLFGEAFLDVLLDHARHRPGAHEFIVAVGNQPFGRLVGQLDSNIAVRKLRFQLQHEFLDHHLDDLRR